MKFSSLRFSVSVPSALLAVGLFAPVTRAQTATTETATLEELQLRRRPAADIRDIQRAALLYPETLALLVRGERALAKGDARAAAEAFKQALEKAPKSALFARRSCQALTQLGRRADAIDACKQALSNYGSAMDLRASVGALMSAPPSMDELGNALHYAEQATRAMPDQPWGYAANCDIALRTGDQTMYATCKQDMERIAPGHYETERLNQSYLAQAPSWVRAIWLAIAGSALLTLGHALRLLFKNFRPGLRRAGAGLCIALATLSAVSPASAEERKPGGLSQWPVNQDDPLASVPSNELRDKNPLEYGYHIMDLADLATAAEKRGDFAAAARFYEASVKAVPDAAVGYRRACEFNQKAGNLQRALEFCRRAMGMGGSHVIDYLRYTDVLFAQNKPLDKTQQEDLTAMIAHLKADPKAAAAAAQIECEVAARNEDRAGLESCTEVLARVAPKEPKTISFQWTLALLQGNVERAEHFLNEARRTPMTPEGVKMMERTTIAQSTVIQRIRRRWQLVFSGALGLGALGVGAWFITRRGRLTTQ